MLRKLILEQKYSFRVLRVDRSSWVKRLCVLVERDIERERRTGVVICKFGGRIQDDIFRVVREGRRRERVDDIVELIIVSV